MGVLLCGTRACCFATSLVECTTTRLHVCASACPYYAESLQVLLCWQAREAGSLSARSLQHCWKRYCCCRYTRLHPHCRLPQLTTLGERQAGISPCTHERMCQPLFYNPACHVSALQPLPSVSFLTCSKCCWCALMAASSSSSSTSIRPCSSTLPTSTSSSGSTSKSKSNRSPVGRAGKAGEVSEGQRSRDGLGQWTGEGTHMTW